MNLRVLTSFLFLVPTVAAYETPNSIDVSVACLACMATSLAYHSNHDNSTLRTIDVYIVRSIAIAYTIHGLIAFGPANPWVIAMLLFGALTLMWYRDTQDARQQDWHVLVHVYAICGVLCYVFARA